MHHCILPTTAPTQSPFNCCLPAAAAGAAPQRTATSLITRPHHTLCCLLVAAAAARAHCQSPDCPSHHTVSSPSKCCILVAEALHHCLHAPLPHSLIAQPPHRIITTVLPSSHGQLLLLPLPPRPTATSLIAAIRHALCPAALLHQRTSLLASSRMAPYVKQCMNRR